MQDPNLRDDAREAASNALVGIGDAAMPFLAEVLEDDAERSLAAPMVVSVIGQIGGQNSVPALKLALATGDPALIEIAALALSRFDDPSAREALIEAFRSDDPTIRGLLAYSVADSQSTEIEKELISLLSDDRLIWENPQMRRVTVAEAAASSLQIIGSEQAQNAVAEWRKKLED
jgi:HEAT repeat protein